MYRYVSALLTMAYATMEPQNGQAVIRSVTTYGRGLVVMVHYPRSMARVVKEMSQSDYNSIKTPVANAARSALITKSDWKKHPKRILPIWLQCSAKCGEC